MPESWSHRIERYPDGEPLAQSDFSIGSLSDELDSVSRVDVDPYVPYGVDKAKRLGLKVYEVPHPPAEYGPAKVAELAKLTKKRWFSDEGEAVDGVCDVRSIRAGAAVAVGRRRTGAIGWHEKRLKFVDCLVDLPIMNFSSTFFIFPLAHATLFLIYYALVRPKGSERRSLKTGF